MEEEWVEEGCARTDDGNLPVGTWPLERSWPERLSTINSERELSKELTTYAKRGTSALMSDRIPSVDINIRLNCINLQLSAITANLDLRGAQTWPNIRVASVKTPPRKPTTKVTDDIVGSE